MVELTCPRSNHVVFGTRWELNPGRGIRIPNRVPLHYGPILIVVLKKGSNSRDTLVKVSRSNMGLYMRLNIEKEFIFKVHLNVKIIF